MSDLSDKELAAVARLHLSDLQTIIRELRERKWMVHIELKTYDSRKIPFTTAGIYNAGFDNTRLTLKIRKDEEI